MNRLRFLLCMIILMWVLPPTQAKEAPSFNRLSLLGFGAKAIALNQTFTAIADDYSATFWNPASISRYDQICFGAMHAQMSLNRTMDYLAFIFPLPTAGHLAVSWADFSVHDVEARTENTLQPDYLFDCFDRMLWVSYSRKIGHYLSIGSNVKLLQSRINPRQAIGYSYDLGVIFSPFYGFQLGLMLHDVGSSMRWNTGKIENFKRVDRVGCSYRIVKKILVSGDVMMIDSKSTIALGTEIKLYDMLRIRSGIQNDRLSAGTGLSVPLLNLYNLSVNYAVTTDSFDAGLFHVFDFHIHRSN